MSSDPFHGLPGDETTRVLFESPSGQKTLGVRQGSRYIWFNVDEAVPSEGYDPEECNLSLDQARRRLTAEQLASVGLD